MAAGSKFPLLQLPDQEILRTIRVMNLDEIIAFSLTSQKCKTLAASLQIQSSRILIWIDNKITVAVVTPRTWILFNFYTELDMYWVAGGKKQLTEPQSVLVHFVGQPIETEKWKKNDFEMSDWLEHIHTIFNRSELGGIQFGRGSHHFDIDDVKEKFRIRDQIVAAHTGCNHYDQMILQKFSHVDKLCIETNMFQDSMIPQNILMRQLTRINVGFDSEEPTIMTLNDLLVNNSKAILMGNVQISPKSLNKFIKLWMRGANPHMEFLELCYMNRRQGYLGDVTMKGIKHLTNSRRTRRRFKTSGLDDVYDVVGGTDIYRNDGVKATIDVGYGGFTMMVWFDHCVV